MSYHFVLHLPSNTNASRSAGTFSSTNSIKNSHTDADYGKKDIPRDRIIRGSLHLPPTGKTGTTGATDTANPANTAQARGTLIICHGFKGFKDWGFFPYAAEQLAVLTGLHVIRFNFSYNGVGADMLSFSEPERFAVNTYQREQEDLAAVMSLTRSEAFQQWKEPLYNRSLSEPVRIPAFHADALTEATPHSTEPHFILGHSRGGATALLYALDHPDDVAGVLTWNGVTNPDLFTVDQKEQLRSTGRSQVINARTGEALPLDSILLEDLDQHQEQYRIIERMSDARFPLIMVQGSDDLPGFREGSARLQQQYKAAHWVTIDEAGHTFQAVHPFQGTTPQLNEAIEVSAKWLLQQQQTTENKY